VHAHKETEKDQMPVDSSKVSGPVADLAAALGSLRVQAGTPSLREIARRAGTISHTTVADALAGTRVPSWDVISAFVRACDGDEDRVRRKWLAARNAELASADGDAGFISQYLRQVASLNGMVYLPDPAAQSRPRFEDLYIPQHVVPMDGGHGARLFELDDRMHRAVLLGAPGAGKSTACRSLMLRHARVSERRVPFLISAREFAAVIPPARSVADHIAHTVESVFQVPVPDGTVTRLLAEGRALVIIDGLDELPAAAARATAAIIELFCREFLAAQVLVTARPIGYMQAQLDPEEFQLYQLTEFSRDQVTEYVHRWLSLGSHAGDASERWLTAFVTETGWLQEISANPLLLTMICQLYVRTGSVPRNRTDLIARMSALLISGWDQIRGIGMAPSAAAAVTPALQYMACQMLDEGLPEITGHHALSLLTGFLAGALRGPGQAASTAQSVLEYSRDRTWILREASRASDGDALYQFTHLTFMEYLAASYLADGPDTARELALRLGVPRWRFAAELVTDIAARNTEGGSPGFLAAVESEVDRLQPEERAQATDFIQQYRTSHAALDTLPVQHQQADDTHTSISGRLASAKPPEAPDRQQAATEHEQAALPAPPADMRVSADPMDTARNVFLIHGRDSNLAASFRDLLQAMGLRPLEWETLVRATGHTAPPIGEVIDTAARLAQATLVLLSPDDIVEPHPDVALDSPRQERSRAGQPSANVLIELGMALAATPERTILVEVGPLMPITDLAGLNVIRFDGSPRAVKKLLNGLKLAGCPVTGAPRRRPARREGFPGSAIGQAH
jgi:predicted nucleotide-binding protein